MPHKKGHSWKDLGKSIKKQAKTVSGAFVKGKNKSQLLINKFNPQSDQNKKIRKKENIIKSDKSTRQEKSVAKVQKSAIKRGRDGVKIADLQAKRRQEMRDRAAAKNKAFKEKQKAFRNRKKKK